MAERRTCDRKAEWTRWLFRRHLLRVRVLSAVHDRLDRHLDRHERQRLVRHPGAAGVIAARQLLDDLLLS